MYRTEMVCETVNGQLSQHFTRYHFSHVKPALKQLLQIDVGDLDKTIAKSSGKDSYISKAEVTIHDSTKVVELIAVKDQNTEEKVSEPGIHLKFHWPIGVIESHCRIDLSGLGNYGQDDKYLLVANYYKGFSKALPILAMSDYYQVSRRSSLKVVHRNQRRTTCRSIGKTHSPSPIISIR